MSRWAAPQGSAPPHRAGRHRRPPRPGGQGLPPPRPPGSNGSGTSPTSARGSDSCIWPPFWTAATRESRRLRHGRGHEDRPDLQGHRYGRAPLPPPGGGHDLPLRPGQSVHLTAIRQTSEELQDPPLRRENRRVLGQCLGGILQRHPGRTNASTPVVYPTREKVIKDVASWIELTYNHTRLHSALGYRTPNEAEHELNSRKQAA